MGLDIYLSEFDDYEKAKALDKAHDEESEGLWAKVVGEGIKYEEASEAQKDAYGKALKACSVKYFGKPKGDEVYARNPHDKKIERDSKKHPKHMFKIGYLRSSYNGGGFNNVCRRMLNGKAGEGLYYIFEHDDKVCEFKPDWEQALARAKEVRDALKAEDKGYDVFKVSANAFKPSDVSDAKQARKIFEAELARRDGGGMDSYSNVHGEFYLGKPIEVMGVIPGYEEFLGRNIPCSYIVYKQGQEDPDRGVRWYIDALDVIIEMCEWAIKYKNKDKLYMYWSA